MDAKPVQVSFDIDLLTRIDRDPEALAHGRAAFIRSAVQVYLAAKRRHEVESLLADACLGQSDAMLEEVADLLDRQTWPNG